MRASSSGALKPNWKWASCANEEDCSSLTLNAEGVGTITWGAGDNDQIKRYTVTMDADTIVAGEIVVGQLVFEASGSTLTVVATCNASIVWIP